MKLQNKWMRHCALVCVFVLTVALGACSKPKEQQVQSAYPGTPGAEAVTLNITSEPTDLNPMLMSDSISDAVLRHTMSGLTRMDKNDKPVMDIAEAIDANADNTQHTIRLRKDAVWSNGAPVTAHDFYFAWTTQMQKDTGAPFANMLYLKIKNGEAYYNGTSTKEELGVKVIDEHTLEVTWESPMPAAASYFSFPFFLPLNQKAYEEIGAEQYAKDADKMVTNGAYSISEWIHDDHITLQKSSTYFNQQLANIPQVKLVMITDDNTSLNAFMAGEVDLTNLYSDKIDSVKTQDANAVKSYIDGGSWYLAFNQKNKFLGNANLRKAMSYAVDVQTLLDNVIKDGSIAANGLVPDVVAGAGSTTYAKARGGIFSYDPAKAKEHFDAALSELGVSATDVKLEILTSDTTYNQNQSAYLQQQWKEKLGLDVSIKVMANKAKVAAQRSGEYDLYVQGWGPTENDPMTFLENFGTTNPNNNTGYSSNEYDNLLQSALKESNAEKRQELYIEAEKMLINDGVIGPLYFTCTTYTSSGKLQGVARTPFQLFNLTDGARIAS